MKNKGAIDTAAERAESILTRRDENIKIYSDHINDLTSNIRAFETQIINAEEAGDFNSCNNARKSILDAEEEIKFYKERVARLNNEPLATKEECNTMCNGIVAEFNTNIAEYKKRVAKIVAELQEIAEQEEALFSKADNIRISWQRDIIKMQYVPWSIDVFNRTLARSLREAIKWLKDKEQH